MQELQSTDLESELSVFKYGGTEQIPPEYRGLSEAERDHRIAAARDELGDDVVVLGHNYQRREIVERADYVGDSYGLSEAAADTDATYVVFCGVAFMAETADVLTRDDQTVVLPSLEAACPMAGMAETLQVDDAWTKIERALPDRDVVPVAYMNTYADLKAFAADHGGLVCTSSNAHDAVDWALDRGDAVLFMPDEHLGRNVARDAGLDTAVWNPWDPDAADGVDDADVLLWKGYCQVHERFTPDHVADVRDAHPDATVVVHPECRRSVVDAADVAGSTAQIRDYVEDADPGDTVAIGTEIHLVNHLQRWHPDVNVVPLCGDACSDCNAMRQIDPNALTWVLEELAAGNEPNVVAVDDEVRARARTATERMLDL